MLLNYKKSLLGGILFVLTLLLIACGSPEDNNLKGSTGGAPPTTVASIAPRQVAPKTNRGGKGPQVIIGQTPVPGGTVGSQKIVLKDRIVNITSLSKQKALGANSTLVNLGLTIQNTSSNIIMNQSTFFLLLGTEGDTFNYQYNSSDNFYGKIAAHGTNSGIITFQVPTAVTTTHLSLMYRPEIPTEAAIILLNIS